jgi:hypothetical protein
MIEKNRKIPAKALYQGFSALVKQLLKIASASDLRRNAQAVSV